MNRLNLTRVERLPPSPGPERAGAMEANAVDHAEHRELHHRYRRASGS